MSNFDNYVVKQVLRNRDSIYWCIEAAFTGAAIAQSQLQALGAEFTMQEVLETKYGESIVEFLEEGWEKIQARRQDERWDRKERKLNNRKRYTRRFNMEVLGRKDMTCTYRFVETVESKGLMACVLENMDVPADRPVVLNVMNRLPRIIDEDGRETRAQHQVPYSEAELFWQHGLLFSAGKTLWNFEIEELREMFLRAFPKAIDFSSYNRRFRAPLVPGGYLPGRSVIVHNNHVRDQMMGSDGAGCYDPAHPDMAELVERYGAVAFQLTAIRPQCGTVFKGILVPREGINGNLAEGQEPAGIWFDHLQVKGVNKGVHKLAHKQSGLQIQSLDDVHIGIMKAKTTFGKVSSCFETLENIGPDPGQYDKKSAFIKASLRVRSILKELTEQSLDRIGELGPEGLLARACRDDLHLRRLAEFIVMSNDAGANINPLDIPILNSKVSESLRKTLWNPAQGAGMIGKYPMVVIDNTLAAGECVVANYRPGQEIACWRFPTILAQGLRVLTVVRSRAQHRVDGKVIPNIIFMNQHDIVTCQQGDDDGDEVGISSDSRIIELFKMRKDNRVFHIEPEGQKLDFPTDSPEGRLYIAGDPMGPVGKVTIMKAGLAATKRKDYELAFAVGIQEAIDAQKNLVRPTDVHRASDINNWYQDENGEYHIHYQVDGEYVTDNFASDEAGEFPLEMYQEAYDAELIASGCVKVVRGSNGNKFKAGWPLGWRTQHRMLNNDEGREVKVKIHKAVAVDNWMECVHKQDGEHQNWVHFVHDVALEAWKGWHGQFKQETDIPTKEVLHQVLRNLGIVLHGTPTSWEVYKSGLRDAAGLNKFGQDMKRIRSKADVKEEARLAQIDQIRAELDIKLSALNAQQLLTIWDMELTDTWWYKDRGRVYVNDKNLVPAGKACWLANTPNYALSAVTARHSAIMRLLGFEATESCQFLNEGEDRARKVINWVTAKPDVIGRFVKMVRADKSHGHHCHDGNGAPVELGDCPDCMNHLETMLIRHVRMSKTAAEKQAVMTLCTSMNSQDHEPFAPVPDEDDYSQPLWT